MAHFAIYPLLPVLLMLSTAAAAHELPAAVKRQLLQSAIPETAIGVYVHQVGALRPLLAVNADTGMNPASAMKLLTTYAGLELLGPAFTWPTEIYAGGKVIDGTLQGDLIIKGYGDPQLNLENFWLLIRRLHQTGLTEIQGDLVLDNSHYAIPGGDPGVFDGQPYRTYNVLPEAILVNYRASTVLLFPQPEKNAVRVVIDPLPGAIQIRNLLQLTSGECGDWRNRLTIDTVTGETPRNQFILTLKGDYSRRCGTQSHTLSLQAGSDYIYDLFKHFWEQQGGKLTGNVAAGKVPQHSTLLTTHHSPTLTEIVRGINKFSNNIAARQLYLALGTGNAITDSAPATLIKSEIAIRQWLADKQLDFPELVLENGSGLSRTERISARHMGKLLLTAFDSPVMPEFMSSLPIAAIDGTLTHRFTSTPVKGSAHMKTGALNDVRALAGYLLDQKGRRTIVVFFANHELAAQSRAAMDALVAWIHQRP